MLKFRFLMTLHLYWSHHIHFFLLEFDFVFNKHIVQHLFCAGYSFVLLGTSFRIQQTLYWAFTVYRASFHVLFLWVQLETKVFLFLLSGMAFPVFSSQLFVAFVNISPYTNNVAFFNPGTAWHLSDVFPQLF